MSHRNPGGFKHTGRIAIGALPLVIAFAACLPDPKGEFDDYVERTNGKRGVVPDTGTVDVGPVDVGGDASALSGTFLASCMPALLGGDASKSLLFYAEVMVSGDKMDLTMSPLRETATKFTKAEIVGNSQVIKGMTLGTDLTFKATVGSARIPGNSQRIGDSELVLENLSYDGRFTSADRLCAELQGKAVSPIELEFNGPGDICVLVRLAEGSDLPKVKTSDAEFTGLASSEHHCP